ncbi:hypothetical protein, partial [Pseudomonas syringae]|uniref:hypothetical protein n=1 Tax=Pseudomonas syringae TaxID=317 RepID=UPI001E50F07C
SPAKEYEPGALATGSFQLVLILILSVCINYDRCRSVRVFLSMEAGEGISTAAVSARDKRQ